MDNQLFSRISGDYYVRHYELNPEFTNGQQVTIYAECSPNTAGTNGHYYALNLYFSANGIPVRDHIIGITFGESELDRERIDSEIDTWTEQIISEDTFPVYLKDYTTKEKLWEDAQTEEYVSSLNSQDNDT